MRAPTKSEKFLLGIFGAMVLGFLGLVVWGWLQRSLAHQRSQEIVLREQTTELHRWQGEKETWESRGRWLAGNPPPPWQREDSEAAFVQDLQRSVAASGLEILSQRLAGSASLPGFEEVTVQLTVRASTEELVRWLHGLQQPGRFLAVRQLNVRADGDKENLRAELQLTQFYQTVDGVPRLEEGSSMPETIPDESDFPAEGEEVRVPLSPPVPITPLTSSADEEPDLPRDEFLEAEEDLPPNPVLPFDDVFDSDGSEDPVHSPDPEVFELLPVPATP